MHDIRSAAIQSSEPATPGADNDEPRALCYFPAKSPVDALSAARALLRSAESCPRCASALAHLYDRLGSTLFRDDDPRGLLEAFEAGDQNACTLKILAACILVTGRERILPTLH